MDRKQDRSLAAKCQTGLVFSVSPDSFVKRKLAGLTAIGRHSLHPPGRAKPRGVWSLCGTGAHESLLTVLPVCGRRNERSGSLVHLSADAEWSVAAAKLASPSSGAGGTVRMLGAK